jgi:glutathione S-transferase
MTTETAAAAPIAAATDAMTLYELAAPPGVSCWSPYVWRVRMVLRHKGLGFRSVPVNLTRLDAVPTDNVKGLPVLHARGQFVHDSWRITCFLEETFAASASVCGGKLGRAHTKALADWTDHALIGGLRELLAADILRLLPAEDKDYFRSSRQVWFGRTIEATRRRHGSLLRAFREALAPMRTTLATQPFLGGESPSYADYAAFGPLQCARIVRPKDILESSDPVHTWRARMLDLFDGYAASAAR